MKICDLRGCHSFLFLGTGCINVSFFLLLGDSLIHPVPNLKVEEKNIENAGYTGLQGSHCEQAVVRTEARMVGLAKRRKGSKTVGLGHCFHSLAFRQHVVHGHSTNHSRLP